MIKQISVLDAFSVRHPVLRSGKSISTCAFEGDNLPTSKHFGIFFRQKLVGVISLFEKNNDLFGVDNQFQIRGMAVLESHQKKGFGAQLVSHAEQVVISNKGNLIWFNARIAAISFYEKMGYCKIGNDFEIDDIGKHFVMFKRLID